MPLSQPSFDDNEKPNDVESDEGVVVDSDHDNLVAYLDGELSAEETVEIEQRLTHEPALRNRLSALQQSWDLLDSLPRAHPEQNFTRSTIEMVALTVRNDIETVLQKESREARNRWIWAVLFSGAVALVSFGAVRYRLEAPNRALANDLPVIDRVDLYRNVGEIEFLVRLSEEGLFDEPIVESR